jgi:hypothetical protein
MIYMFVLLWAICGVIAYGSTFAHFQRSWPSIADEDYTFDMRMAILFGFGGPCAMAALFILGGFKHGFKWK